MSEAAAPRVVCAGMAVLDQVFFVDRFPAPNTKARADAFFSVVGGCAANAAIAIARLGGHAELAAVIGGASHDDIGDHILSGLTREGVACDAVVRVPEVPSTISTIMIDAVGDRTIATRCDDRLRAATLGDPRELVAAADAVLVDNWLPDLVLPVCVAARERGIPVVLDGDAPMPAASRLAALATHLVFSADALRATAGRDDLGEALMAMARQVTAFVAVTDGANDIAWVEGGALRRRPVFTVAARDTLAAGDVFHGAFALALAEGFADAEALRFAAAVAAIKCTRRGGGQGTPWRAEVDAFLAGRG